MRRLTCKPTRHRSQESNNSGRTLVWIGWLFLFSYLAACTSSSTTPLPASLITLTPIPTSDFIQTVTPTAQPAFEYFTPTSEEIPPTATITSTLVPPAVFLPPYLPLGLREAFNPLLEFSITTDPAEADIRLDLWSATAANVQSITWWTYVLVAPFPTISQGVTAEDLHQAWNGQSSGSFAGIPILMDAETLAVFSAWWGSPTDGAVQVIPSESLVDTAWAQQPAWGIVPFEALEPRLKVLRVDGLSPLQRDFETETYPLSIPFALTASRGLVDWSLPDGNRDPNRLTILDMTGVTAMVRGTALWMERYGIAYPAQDVGPILSSADITHISNEIPFVADCPYPELYPTELVFCSRPAYMDLLEAVGADVIELTGDHLSDWGPDAMYNTLALYEDRNMSVYGGGINAEQARRPLLIEHNGNRLAFLGCNIGCQIKPQVPCDALASEELPGAAACDFDWLQGEVDRLSDEGYQVIFTFQHREEYTYTATHILIEDFGQVAQMGAVIVSGSQAHQPHGFAFQNGAFIHYGLGNLFFDQYHFCADFACDYAFIDRYTFYAGRHISTELIPIRFVDLARPRLMTPEETAHFLEIIFTASGW
jgi:hypothetical protein